MAAGIDDIIVAVAAEIEVIAAEILSIGSELTKQPKPDYNKSNSQRSNQSIVNTVNFTQRGKT
jgi:hypothetical protein